MMNADNEYTSSNRVEVVLLMGTLLVTVMRWCCLWVHSTTTSVIHCHGFVYCHGFVMVSRYNHYECHVTGHVKLVW
jgi:hypothetical protein